MATRTLTNTATIVQDVSVAGEVLLNLNLVGGDASINTGTGALTVSKIGGQAVTLGGALTISGAFGTTLTVTNTTAVTLPTSGTLAILGANTFTTLQTITQASANTGILASTGYSLTGTNATSMLSLAGTVNTTGNPNILSCAITNTAAGTTTKYLNLLAGAAGATSVFSVDLTGNTVGASLALGGATLGTDILAVTGKSTLSDRLTITQATANTGIIASTGFSLTGANASSLLSITGTVNTSGNPNILSCAITNTAAGATTKYLNLLAGAAGATSIFSVDLTGNVALASSVQIAGNGIHTSPAAATLQLGAADAAAPVAQTLRVQNVVTATSNTAGANFTISGSTGTGTGAGGSIIFQTSPATGTGSTPNALVPQLTIASTGIATFAAPVVLPSFATGARTATTDGVGAIYYNSTLGNPQFSNGTSWFTIPDLTDAYTWAGVQTFNAGIISAAGASTGTIQAAGMINRQVSSTGVSPGGTAGDYVLASYALPASVFDVAGREIVIIGYGNYAANGSTKEVKIYVNCATATVGSLVTGGTVIGDAGAVTTSGGGWRLSASVVKYGAGASNTQVSVQNTGLSSISASQNLSMTENGTILIAVTGNATSTATDIVFKLLTIECLN